MANAPQPLGAVISIPTLRSADGPSVALQPAHVSGSLLFAVTVRDRGGQRRDRWFGSESAALAHAVEQADALGLLLLDLRDGARAE